MTVSWSGFPEASFTCTCNVAAFAASGASARNGNRVAASPSLDITVWLRETAASRSLGAPILDLHMHKRALGRKRLALRIAAAGTAVFIFMPARAQESPLGRFTFELRPRYNHIEESDKPEVTRGGTVRILAGYASAPIDATMRIVLEGIHADHIDPHFNDDGNNFASSPYPLLPDPKYTGINQAYVDFTGVESARVRAGRQVVRMDNQRWVSDNNFRQTPQVFDGVSARYGTPLGIELYGAYFGQVRTTSGDENDLNLTLLHAAWNPLPGHALVAYGYFHDQPSNGAFTGFANSSYRVTGVRAEGTAF